MYAFDGHVLGAQPDLQRWMYAQLLHVAADGGIVLAHEDAVDVQEGLTVFE